MKKILLICLILPPLLKLNAQTVTVKLEFVDHSYDGYQDFSKLASQYLERIINSKKFKDRLLKTRMKKTQGKTNKQIYELILKGYETQCPERINIDSSNLNNECPKQSIKTNFNCPENNVGEINLKVRTINQCDGDQWLNKNCELDSSARTIGIDGNGDGITAICPQRLEKWFNDKRIDLLAGHYMHEYMHIIGFSHRGCGRYKSVVYKIGYLVQELIRDEIMKDNYKCSINAN